MRVAVLGPLEPRRAHLLDGVALLGQGDRAYNARDADAYHARATLAHGLRELERHRPSEARDTTM
eukprot:7436896-Pyramimonas_sp.AAC.1